MTTFRAGRLVQRGVVVEDRSEEISGSEEIKNKFIGEIGKSVRWASETGEISIINMTYLKPDKTLSRVVLPAPDGPRIAIKWPASNRPERFFRISFGCFPIKMIHKLLNFIRFLNPNKNNNEREKMILGDENESAGAKIMTLFNLRLIKRPFPHLIL